MFAPPLQPCSSLETNHTLFTNTTSTSGNTNGCSVSMSSQQIKSTLGIILPPNNIKGIIDKTAEFVAKNGLEFEQRVLADRSNGTKFAFLVPGNPYRPYYDAKLLEFQTGEVQKETQQQIPHAISEMRRREMEKKKKKTQMLALTSSTYGLDETKNVGNNTTEMDRKDPLELPTEEFLENVRPPAPPPDDQYYVPRPPIAPIDMDIIKLTAQYVARNGQKFLGALGQRERGNLQFGFLRMNHPFFSYFIALVDAYSRCFVPPKGVISALKEDIGLASRFSSGQTQIPEDKKFVSPTDVLQGIPQAMEESQLTAMLNIMERVDLRHQWECFEEKKKEEEAKKEADERQKMHAMDWHEFVVVEIIHFTEEDDNLMLGAPIDQESLLNKAVVPLAQQNASHRKEDWRNAHITEEDTTNAQKLVDNVTNLTRTQSISTADEKSTQSSLPSTSTHETSTIPPRHTANPPLVTTTTTTGAPSSTCSSSLLTPLPLTTFPQPTGFTDGPPEPAAPPAAPILVVKDYVRQGKKRGKDATEMQKCPITGQWIPLENMSEHLKVLLLDPKWKEEKDILMAKAQKESAFAPLSDFETNLANFVVKRPDLFGTVEDECESNYVPSIKRRP